MPLFLDNFKSKMEALVSNEFALLSEFFFDMFEFPFVLNKDYQYSVNHLFNIFTELSCVIFSVQFVLQRINMYSLS